MDFEIYYANDKKFNKKDFEFFKKYHINYRNGNHFYSENSLWLPDFNWSKFEYLYDYFGSLVLGDNDNIIIYNDYIE